MYRNYVLEYAPYVMGSIFFVFAVIKLLTITILREEGDTLSLFFRSFAMHSRTELRNIFNERIVQFLGKNNLINTIMYITLGFILAIYIFMKFIVE